jgi:hypothetical protein
VCRKVAKAAAPSGPSVVPLPSIDEVPPSAAPGAPTASTGGEASKGALTSATFAALAQENIAPEDVFFHKYMTLDSVKQRAAANRARKKAQAKQKARTKEADGEDVLPDDESSSEGDGASEGGDSFDSTEVDAFLDTEEQLEVRNCPCLS